MASSAFFNDLGEAKCPASQWIAFNGDTVLTLNWDNRRAWVHGGDRLVKWDTYNYWGLDTVRAHMVVSHFGREPLRVNSITWELESGCSQESLNGFLAAKPVIWPGSVLELGVVEFAAPLVNEVTRLDLKVRLAGSLEKDGGLIEKTCLENSWPLWFYPTTAACPRKPDPVWHGEVGIYDPQQLLKDYPGYKRIVAGYLDAEGPELGDLRSYRVIITTEWTNALKDYVQAGGKAIYLQTRDAYLPSERLPFWREAAQVMEKSPYLTGFDAEGFCHLQWYSLATDRAFTPSGFEEVLGSDIHIEPVLLRLDARKYVVHHYLTEIRLGKGTLLATTLRLFGGLGDQAESLSQSVSGQFLLWQWVQAIQRR